MIIKSSKSFKKDFRKLTRKQKNQFYKRVILFVEGENHSILGIHALKGESKGKRSFNVTGDIRVIYEEIDQDTVLFLMIGTHSNLYGK